MDGVALARKEQKMNGLELRQAHFEMGTDIPTYEDT
jgi:hypothetical protein